MIDSVPVLLKDLAMEAAKRGERITQDKIIDYLKDNGSNLKSPLGIEDIISDFEITSASLTNIRSTIGTKHHIPRDETQRLMEWIEVTSDEKKAAWLIGAMGIGKTVITHDLYKKLKDKSIPVLGIKTDHYAHIKYRKDLYKELGLKDEIVKLVATTVESKGKCVVIFDQMDALSDSLSKDRTSLNIIINLINNLVLIPNVKVIVSCRKFDLDHDPTLSQIDFDPKVEVLPLSIDQVKDVINNLGISVTIFTEKQIKLLQTPLHLQLLNEIYESSMAIDSIQTLQDLFGKLWEKFISKGKDKDIQNKTDAIYKLVNCMDENRELTAPLPLLEKFANAQTELQSSGIIIFIRRNKIGFFHQSFFDYCYARKFVSENKSLTEKILKEHQGLFVRSQIKQILSFLRGSNTSKYINEIKTLLESEKLRYHIEDLILSLLGNQPEPIEDEIDYVRQLFQKDYALRDHFLKDVDSPAWFDILNEDYIPLIKDDAKIISLVMTFYLKILNYRTKEIFTLMEELPDFPGKNEWCSEFLWRLENWCNEAIEFYKKMRVQIKLDDDTIHLIFENIYKTRKKDAFYFLLNEFDSKIEELKTHQDKVDSCNKELIDWDSIELFKKALNDIPDIATKEIAVRLKRIVELSKFGNKERFYMDKAFLLYDPGETLYGIWQLLNEFLESLKKLIKDENHAFIKDIVKIFRASPSVTLNRILCWIYSEAPELFKKEAYELLSSPDALSEVGRIFGYDARSLLRKIFPLLEHEKREGIESIILQIDPEWEREAGKQINRGYSKYIALSAISEEYRSKAANKRFLELERKFGPLSEEKPKPRMNEFETAGSPIPDNSLHKMNLKQWLNAFKKYDDDTSRDGPKHRFLKGGVIELSRAFRKTIQERPDDFYDFVLDLGNNKVSFRYISEAISGFVEAGYDYQKIRALILKYSKSTDNKLRKSIVRAIEKLDEREPMDSELFNVLADYALNDLDPDKELYQVKTENGQYYYRGDPLFYGINTVRGSAAMAITHHGFRTGDSESVFEALEKIADDPFISVRSCMIPDLAGMLRWDGKRTFAIYKRALKDMNPDLLSLSGRLLRYALNNENFKDITSYLKLMASTENHDASKSIGHITMIAVLREYQEAESFLQEMLPVSGNIRAGIAYICIENITNEEYKEKCETQLMALIDDYSEDVVNTIAFHLHRMEHKKFDILYPLIRKVAGSAKGRREIHYMMEYLLKCVSLHPEYCIDLMSNFVHFQTPNMQTNMLTDEAIRIVTGAYLKTSKNEYKEKAMDILDRMYEIGYYKVRTLIEDQDR